MNFGENFPWQNINFFIERFKYFNVSFSKKKLLFESWNFTISIEVEFGLNIFQNIFPTLLQAVIVTLEPCRDPT